MKNAWDKWMVLAKKFGNVQANILLFLVYFLIVVPLGFAFKISGKYRVNPSEKSSYWVPRKKIKQDMIWARKQ